MEVNNIEINEFCSTDLSELDGLLKYCYIDYDLKLVITSPRFREAYTAKVDNKLVGLLVVTTKVFHPYSLYLTMVIHPNYKTPDVLNSLLLTFEENNTINLPMQASIWETDLGLKLLLEENGFQEIRRTYSPKVTLNHFDKIQFFKLDDHNVLIPLGDILENDVQMSKMMNLVKNTYEYTHTANPLGIHDIETWRDEIFSDDLMIDGSYLIKDCKQNQIVAFAFLHKSDLTDTLEFGWRGVERKDDLKLIRLLTLKQIEFAICHGVKYIDGEMDTTDVFSLEMLKFIPFSPAPTWITYQKAL